MQVDFHYYATYAAAGFAGFTPAEMREIAEGAALIDFFNAAYLVKIGGPTEAATTQFQLDLADMTLNRQGIQEITQIWSSFHFLPGDLYAEVKGSRWYRRKYRLICNTNSDLLVKTVELAKGRAPMVMGIAMHVLADTWAHRYFAGTPSLVINNTNRYFYERYSPESSPPELIGLFGEIREKLLEIWDVTLLNDTYSFVFTALVKNRLKKKKADDAYINRYISGISNIESMKPNNVGVIVRTVAEGKRASELDNELNKGAAEKAQKAALYEEAWPVVAAVLADLSEPATATEIFTECGDKLPDDFGQGSLVYALRAVWADRVRKIPGNPNTYALA